MDSFLLKNLTKKHVKPKKNPTEKHQNRRDEKQLNSEKVKAWEKLA
jgi:hypothetical protein